MMHGQLPGNLDEELVGIEQSYQWIKSGDINPLTANVDNMVNSE
jgi:hypothetical protein